MFNQFYVTVAAAALAAACLSTAQAQTLIAGTLAGDRYISPNPPVSTSNGTRDLAPMFAFYKDQTSTFHFNRHYSSLIMKWNLAVPPALAGQSLTITSARVVLWQRAGAGTWVPGQADIKLFATGITGDNGFTTGTWTEAQVYIGPGSASPTPLQDPYMTELGTNSRAEDNLSATPWALGQADPSYNGTAVPTQAVPIVFTFDLNNPLIRARLMSDLESGVSMWTAASTYYASQPGTGTPSDYPRIVTKEGVSNAAYGTAQQAPALIIEVQGQSSVADWNLY